jgi:hypothetical protein
MKRVLLSGKPFAEPLPEGFLYHGYSVFTTLRAEGGRPLWLPDHLARLRRHAEALGLSYPGDEAFLQDLKVLLAAFPQAPCLRLRLTVGEGVWLSEARPYAPLPRAFYREGVRVHLTPYRVHPDLFPYKTGNYLPYRLALEEARRRGAFEGLLLDEKGHVVDGSRTSLVGGFGPLGGGGGAPRPLGGGLGLHLPGQGPSGPLRACLDPSHLRHPRPHRGRHRLRGGLLLAEALLQRLLGLFRATP